MSSWWKTAVIGVVVAWGAGCDSHSHGDEKPGADACEHLEQGPIQAVTAGTAASPVALANAHTRYDLTMSGSGFASIAVGKAGDHYVFFDSSVTVAVKDGAGNPVAPEQSGTSDADCALVKTWFLYELGVGTYTFEITPQGGATLVKLVYFGADHTH